MNGTTRLKIGEINKNLICVLCGGYYIDATTIIECLHSFCRTCIVTYLKTSKTCPVCDTTVHKTRPHQNIRSDKLLQDLVYKLVPDLYKDEMRRRREFYTRHYDAAPKRPGEERGDEMSDRFAYTEEENISLALYLCTDGFGERVDFRRVFSTKEDMKTRMERRIKESVDVRYLQCKAALTIGLLKKFVRLKYGFPSHFQVDMYYNDEPLRDSCTLCDVAYIFNWRRRAPLSLTFCVYQMITSEKPGWEESVPTFTHSTVLKNKSKASVTSTATHQPKIPSKSPTSETVTTSISNIVRSTCSSTVTATTTITAKTATVASATASLSVMSIQSTPKKVVPSLQEISDPHKEKSSGKVPVPQPENISAAEQGKSKEVKARTGVKRIKSKVTADSSSPVPAKIILQTAVKTEVQSSSKPSAPAPAKNGSSKQMAKNKATSLLGKRPANTPIPIAPAPAKVVALNSSMVDISKFIKVEPGNQARGIPQSGTPKMVSLLPLCQTSRANSAKASNKKTPSNVTFSISSILNVVTNSQNISSASINNMPSLYHPVTAMATSETVLKTTSANPTFSLLSPMSNSLVLNHVSTTNVKAPITFTAVSQTKLAKHQTPSSTSWSTTASVTQHTSTTSIASPIPAASASPTLAAVPVQQSQTQGSDRAEPPPTPVQKIKGVPRVTVPGIVMMKRNGTDSNSVTPHNNTARAASSPVVHTQVNASNIPSYLAPCFVSPSLSKGMGKLGSTATHQVQYSNENRGTHSINTSTVQAYKPSLSSPQSLDSSASSTSSFSSPELNSEATSPLSPTSGSTNGINGCRKQVKQKKIADIANTLHKRMSETLQNQNSNNSNSQSGRRQTQPASPGMKNGNVSLSGTNSNIKSTPELDKQGTMLKQSLQNFPLNGKVIDRNSASETATNVQSDEPLNLVKKDKDTVRLTNGMFILDIPPSIK